MSLTISTSSSSAFSAPITKQSASATREELVYTKLFLGSIFGPYLGIPEWNKDNELANIAKSKNTVHIPLETTISKEQLEKIGEDDNYRKMKYYQDDPKVIATLTLTIENDHLDQIYVPEFVSAKDSGFYKITPLFIVNKINITNESWNQNLSPQLTKLLKEGRSDNASRGAIKPGGIVWEVVDPRTPTFPQNTNISIPPEPTKNLTVTPKNNCCVTS